MADRNIEIRPGRPDDPIREIAALVWSTDPELMVCLFQNEDLWHTAAAEEWRRGRGLITPQNTISAFADGRLCGATLGFPAHRAAAIFGEAQEVQRASLPASDVAQFDIGFAAMERLFPEPDPGAFHVMELAVAPDARGRGIGRALLVAAAERARAEGCTSLALDVAADNPAVRLYRSLGFEVAVETRLPKLEADYGIGKHFHMVGPLDLG